MPKQEPVPHAKVGLTMSHHQKKKREIFLLSKLTSRDYQLIFIVVLALLFLVSSFFVLNNPRFDTVQSAPTRGIKDIHNLTRLWDKEEFYLPSDMHFFMPSGSAVLVFPSINKSHTSYYALQAIDMITGQTLWQTEVPYLGTLRLYDDKLFNLQGYVPPANRSLLENAPVRDNKELNYCSFSGTSLLSIYDVHTGQELWGYKYRGISTIYFENDIVYLHGTGDHGQSGLLAKVDINSGMINDQYCARIRDDKPAPIPPKNSQSGIVGSSSLVTSYGSSYYCSGRSRFCFITEGNRLNILAGDPKTTVAYIDFSGEQLNEIESDVVVHNNIAVVHLDDSNQLFAFRLP